MKPSWKWSLLLLLAACGDDAKSGNAGADTGVEDSSVADTEADADTDTEADGSAADTAGDTVADGSGSGADTTPVDTTPPPEGDYRQPVDPVIFCEATPPVCSSATDLTTYAMLRKDASLDERLYPEFTERPRDGGRVQIAGIAAVSGRVRSVQVDERDLEAEVSAQNPTMEWYHVWPEEVVAGQPIWLSLHSRSPAWDDQTVHKVTIVTDQGEALSERVVMTTTTTPITYVTTADEGTRLLFHAQNRDDRDARLRAVTVNGIRYEASEICGLSGPIAPGASVRGEIKLCEPLKPGAAWTVALDDGTGVPSVGAGRVVPEYFPIEAWPVSDDCPVPTSEPDTEALTQHLAAGFDTFYLYWNGRCNAPTAEVLNSIAPQRDDYRVLIGDDYLSSPDAGSGLLDTTRAAGFLIGDEVDGEIYDADGLSRPNIKARETRQLWSMHPELPVYNGAKTHGHVGTFAGIADIQGIDYYISACAPHITEDGAPIQLLGAYDFLRNTRENMMPLPTWQYAQGLHSGWNLTRGTEVFHRQPAPQEMIFQAFSAMAAGAKGLMWFQTSLDEAAAAPRSWEAIGDSNRAFRAVRKLLREGDLSQQATVLSGEVLAQTITARAGIVMPLLNTNTTSSVTDALCLRNALFPEEVPHWTFGETEARVTVKLSPEQRLSDVFEVGLDGLLHEVEWYSDAEARTVTIEAIPMSNEAPARLFVLAGERNLRSEIEAILAE
ncbi:MAG: hypothetical protein HQ461_08995 [Deltaproteobacteria bacterium]|nr:hypothetical protein [Deltaproteobacteria bacterium]